MRTCAHLIKSDEAYRDGSPTTVHLCDWPDQNPSRFIDAPLWLLKQIGGGLMVQPEHDCIGCKGFKAELPK